MPAEKNDTPWTEDFALGTPALVCRWRLADRTLPLENRHLRALSRRVVDDAPVSPQLVAWAKQHIEWTLGSGASRYPDGVLMVIETKGEHLGDDARRKLSLGTRWADMAGIGFRYFMVFEHEAPDADNAFTLAEFGSEILG